MLQLQKYDIDLTYKRGKDMHLTDTLSRAPCKTYEKPSPDEDSFVVMMVSYFPSSCSKYLAAQTTDNDTLRSLSSVIQHGWPDKQYRLSLPIRPFFSVRAEIVLKNGIIVKGHKAVIPASLHSKYFHAIHGGHPSAEATILLAKSMFFWPGMADYIRERVERCAVCNNLAPHQ